MTPDERANADSAALLHPVITPVITKIITQLILLARRHRLPLLLLGWVGVVGALFWPSVASLLIEWFDTEKRVYTHGPLLAGLSLWLLVRANAGRDPAQFRGPSRGRSTVAASLLPFVVLALLSVLWLVVYRAGIQVGHQALLPVILWFVLWAALGREVAGRSAIAVALLYWAIPIWNVGVDTLQAWTVSVVRLALQVSGVPAYVNGNLVSIRSGVFEVADGCAGLHYFVVATAVAVLYGELGRDSLKVRTIMVVLAAAIAVVVNWLRVFVVIVAGYLSDMQNYLVRVDHYYFGWILFAVAMVAFFVIANRFPARAEEHRRVPTAAERVPLRSRVGQGVLAVLALALGPLCAVLLPLQAAAALNVVLPERVTGWSGPQPCELSWTPRFPAADFQQRLEYRFGADGLCAYTASYLLQRQGKEVVSYENSLFGGDDGEAIAGTHQAVASWSLNELRVAGGSDGGDLLVWFTYVIGAAQTPRATVSQLRYGLASLTSNPPSTVFAMAAPCGADCGAARTLLRKFLLDSRLPMTPALAAAPLLKSQP